MNILGVQPANKFINILRQILSLFQRMTFEKIAKESLSLERGRLFYQDRLMELLFLYLNCMALKN